LRDATAASAARCESGVRIAVHQLLHRAERCLAVRAAVVEELRDDDFRIRRTDDIGDLRIEKRIHAADVEQRVVARLLLRRLLLRVQPVRHLHDDVGIGEQIFAHHLLDLSAVRPHADRHRNPPDGDRGGEGTKGEERYAPRSEFH
jgi:hypothetical protein